MSQPSFQDWLNRESAGPKPKKPLKRTRVARVSKRRRRDGAVYSARRKEFLEANPICQVVIPGTDICEMRAKEVHHRAGRTGTNYLNENTWMAICPACHRWVHEHPGQARLLGFMD